MSEQLNLWKVLGSSKLQKDSLAYCIDCGSDMCIVTGWETKEPPSAQIGIKLECYECKAKFSIELMSTVSTTLVRSFKL